MTGTTLTASTAQVDLASYGTGNPFFVPADVAIANSTGGTAAIYGATAAGGWTLTNSGTVSSTKGGSDGGCIGVDLRAGSSTLTNAGSVSGGAGFFGYNIEPNAFGFVGGAGVILSGDAGSVSNSGTIAGGAGGGYPQYRIGDNGYAGGAGVILSGNAGIMSNSGVISGGAGGDGSGYTMHGGNGAAGVMLSGTAFSLTNSGAITGGAAGGGSTVGSAGDGVILADGCMLTNMAGGVISGGAGAQAYYVAQPAGAGARLGDGDTLVNMAGGIISGGPSPGGSTYGDGVTGGDGVDAGSSTSLTNAGTIDGAGGQTGNLPGLGGFGIRTTGRLTITNSGTIAGGKGGNGPSPELAAVRTGGLGGSGISIGAGGDVSNSGTITGGVGGNGAAGGAGGSGLAVDGIAMVTNQAGARIAGGSGGGAAPPWKSPKFLSGAGGAGLVLEAGGIVTNSGTVAGGDPGTASARATVGTGGIGISFGGNADSTLINSGVISGGSGAEAVQFGAGDDRFVMYSTGSLIGGADGGAGANTLELASGDIAGNISGVLTKFQTITVDADAYWNVGGGIGAATVTVKGDLIVKGPTQISGVVAGAGRFTLAGATTIADGAKLTVANLAVSGGATVNVKGTVNYAGTLTQAGGTRINIASGETVTLHGGARLAGAVTGAGSLVLAGATTTFAGNAALTVPELTLTGGAAVTVDSDLTYAGTLAAFAGTSMSILAGKQLKLAGPASGTGSLNIGVGAILTATRAVAGSLKVVFRAKSGTLQLTAPGQFKAGISGFVAGDRIDIANSAFAYNPAEKVTFAENAAKTGGTLRLINGSHSTALRLFGQYVASGFHIAGDGHGGTLIAYKPPGANALDHLAAGGG